MLHQIRLISVFQPFGNQAAFDISAVDKIHFKIPVSSGDCRCSDPSGNGKQFIGGFYLYQRRCNFPAVNLIDGVFYVGISGSMQLHLIVYHQFKRDIRTG